mgnify:CR=1 FL=1
MQVALGLVMMKQNGICLLHHTLEHKWEQCTTTATALARTAAAYHVQQAILLSTSALFTKPCWGQLPSGNYNSRPGKHC